jgi:hypothetical protein
VNGSRVSLRRNILLLAVAVLVLATLVVMALMSPGNQTAVVADAKAKEASGEPPEEQEAKAGGVVAAKAGGAKAEQQ